MRKITHEEVMDFIEAQIQTWPLAKKNLEALRECSRRKFSIGDLHGALQFNPARIVSTASATDSASISGRPCFLCSLNRPKEQIIHEIEAGWEMLVNPYPIFPIHLTIVSTAHLPQRGIPYEMISMAERLEGMTVFFNGAKAGASAPDHLHLQAVLTEELPLMRLLEDRHPGVMKGVFSVSELDLDLPFEVKSAVIYPDLQGMEYIRALLGNDNEGFVNVFCWLDSSGLLRIARIDRRAHRPNCYGHGEGRHLVSPGCIDMAGVIITPIQADFEDISSEELKIIYEECGLPPKPE